MILSKLPRSEVERPPTRDTQRGTKRERAKERRRKEEGQRRTKQDNTGQDQGAKGRKRTDQQERERGGGGKGENASKPDRQQNKVDGKLCSKYHKAIPIVLSTLNNMKIQTCNSVHRQRAICNGTCTGAHLQICRILWKITSGNVML